jgi:hypothetical protein
MTKMMVRFGAAKQTALSLPSGAYLKTVTSDDNLKSDSKRSKPWIIKRSTLIQCLFKAERWLFILRFWLSKINVFQGN